MTAREGKLIAERNRLLQGIKDWQEEIDMYYNSNWDRDTYESIEFAKDQIEYLWQELYANYGKLYKNNQIPLKFE